MKSRISLILILAILSFSTIIPALAYAAPLAQSDKDWQYVNGNSWGWNYSPETQITKDNVDQLEVKWIYPVQGGTAPAGMQALNLMEGSNTPPVVVNGKVYIATQQQRTVAIDAKTGKQLWTHDYVIDPDEIKKRLPVNFGPIIGSLGLFSHIHGFRYWDTGKALLLAGLACDFYGVDANTGETSFWYKDLCANIDGNIYMYRQGSVSQTNIGTYEKGNQFIFVLPGAMHSMTYVGDFRHTTIGVDMDTGQIIWKVFSYPPQGIPTKDWALQECDIGFFQDIPCTDVEAAAPENLEWDWAQPNEPPSVYGGVTANWGELIVDEDTGIIYTQTGNQGPYTNVGSTPGPRLYGSTIMAIDMEKGQRIWWMQPFPRDPYDYDCNWGGILADVPGVGKVYMKGCKEGRLNVLDAETGEPIYIKDLTDEQYSWGQITRAGTLEPTEGGIKYHLTDPFSYYDMRELESPDNSKYCGRPCDVYPSWSNGIFATDMSYDPETATLFHYAAALQRKIIESPAAAPDQSVSITQPYPITNTTIVARDAATGNVKWTWYYDVGQQRAHMVVTPELLFTGFTDGFMRFFDKDNGDLLREMNLGAIMRIGVTTGKDSDGNQMIFTMTGISSTFGGSVNSGILVAIGLSERAAAAAKTVTTTVTTTSRTTLTTTTTSVSTTTATTTQTITSTTTRSFTTTATSTTTLSTTSTVVSTAAPSTTTVTSEITETTGLPTEVTYAAVAVAVIAIIGAAVLATRRR